jgi:prepilin-type N-terminal cleavage/methylation domain-containing protein/prepilin-type processing-associated H-X9-DG protein
MKRGFTLIELLVVVAIIAVLVAVLLPALSAAREQGKSVVCQTNLRQLGMVFRYYAEDHNDFIASNSAQPGGSRWYDVLAAYRETQNRSRNRNIYICPSEEATVWDTDPDGTRVNPITNYAQSTAVMYAFRARRWPSGPREWMDTYRFSEIETPTAKVLLVDAKYAEIPVCDYLFYGNAIYQNFISDRHSKGANALYMDGHAEWDSWVNVADPNKIAKFFPDK